MSNQRNLLVGLDLSPMDDFLLSFLDQNAQKMTDQEIKILHTNAHDGTANEEKKEQIAHKLPPSLADSEIIMTSGKPKKELELICDSMHIDMVVLGQKPESEDHVKADSLSEKVKSSLLLLPPKEDYDIKEIYVALDFSDYSMTVLSEAQKIAKLLDSELKGLHTYQVASGYHKTGKDHKEFAKEMEENARNEASDFLKKAGIELDIHFLYEEDKDTASCIAGFTENQPMDLLIVGSKGRTNAASVIQGSVARKVIKKIHDTPLMVLKMKDKNMGVAEAIKEV